MGVGTGGYRSQHHSVEPALGGLLTHARAYDDWPALLGVPLYSFFMARYQQLGGTGCTSSLTDRVFFFGVVGLWFWVGNGTIVTLDWDWYVQESHATFIKMDLNMGVGWR